MICCGRRTRTRETEEVDIENVKIEDVEEQSAPPAAVAQNRFSLFRSFTSQKEEPNDASNANEKPSYTRFKFQFPFGASQPVENADSPPVLNGLDLTDGMGDDMKPVYTGKFRSMLIDVEDGVPTEVERVGDAKEKVNAEETHGPVPLPPQLQELRPFVYDELVSRTSFATASLAAGVIPMNASGGEVPTDLPKCPICALRIKSEMTPSQEDENDLDCPKECRKCETPEFLCSGCDMIFCPTCHGAPVKKGHDEFCRRCVRKFCQPCKEDRIESPTVLSSQSSEDAKVIGAIAINLIGGVPLVDRLMDLAKQRVPSIENPLPTRVRVFISALGTATSLILGITGYYSAENLGGAISIFFPMVFFGSSLFIFIEDSLRVALLKLINPVCGLAFGTATAIGYGSRYPFATAASVLWVLSSVWYCFVCAKSGFANYFRGRDEIFRQAAAASQKDTESLKSGGRGSESARGEGNKTPRGDGSKTPRGSGGGVHSAKVTPRGEGNKTPRGEGNKTPRGGESVKTTPRGEGNKTPRGEHSTKPRHASAKSKKSKAHPPKETALTRALRRLLHLAWEAIATWIYCLVALFALWFIFLQISTAFHAVASQWITLNPPGKMIEIETGSIHLLCSGEISPTLPVVVLESFEIVGQALLWELTQPFIANYTRVCSYDRAGFGWSPRSSQHDNRSPKQIAKELHDTLSAAQVPPPYFLVGHGTGSVYVRQFGLLYPQLTAGVVCVDATVTDPKFSMLDSVRPYMTQIPMAYFQAGEGLLEPLGIIHFVAQASVTIGVRNMTLLPSIGKMEDLMMLRDYCYNAIQEIEDMFPEGLNELNYLETSVGYGAVPLFQIAHLHSVLGIPVTTTRDAGRSWLQFQLQISDYARFGYVLVGTGHEMMPITRPKFISESVRSAINYSLSLNRTLTSSPTANTTTLSTTSARVSSRTTPIPSTPFAITSTAKTGTSENAVGTSAGTGTGTGTSVRSSTTKLETTTGASAETETSTHPSTTSTTHSSPAASTTSTSPSSPTSIPTT